LGKARFHLSTAKSAPCFPKRFLGQAARAQGVNPPDIALLAVMLKQG
jgi:tRNA U34 5-carboxymethylaminomethyl modifying enzyme MnmG/GidA